MKKDGKKICSKSDEDVGVDLNRNFPIGFIKSTIAK